MNNPTNNATSCCCSCCPQRCIRLCGCGPNENGICGGNGRCSRFCIPCSKFMKIPKFCQSKSRKNKNKQEEAKRRKSRSQSSEHEIHSSGTDVTTAKHKYASRWSKLNCCSRKRNKMDQKVKNNLKI